MIPQNNSDRLLTEKIKQELENFKFNSMEENWSKMHDKLASGGNAGNSRLVFKKTLNPHRRIYLVISLAASIILLIGLIHYLSYKQNRIEWMEYSTGYKEVGKIVLPDGTGVWVNQMTEIEYPKQFSQQERSIRLHGEAFFEVVPDKQKPFTIVTDHSRIEVVGTSFNVRAYADSPEERVVVASGVVTVRSISNRNNDFVTLLPGETALIHQADTLITKKPNEDANYLAWKSKRLEFKDTPLIDVVRTINELYQDKTIILKSGIDSLALSATFENIDFDILLKSIALTLDLSIQEENDSIVLNRIGK